MKETKMTDKENVFKNLITQDMLDNMEKTDIGFLKVISSSPILCENITVYKRVRKYFKQLHISTYGDEKTLTIIT